MRGPPVAVEMGSGSMAVAFQVAALQDAENPAWATLEAEGAAVLKVVAGSEVAAMGTP